MNVTVITRSVYGRDTVYPVCETAKLLAQLAGHKTLTDRNLGLIRELGYSVTDLAVTGRVRVQSVETAARAMVEA